MIGQHMVNTVYPLIQKVAVLEFKVRYDGAHQEAQYADKQDEGAAEVE